SASSCRRLWHAQRVASRPAHAGGETIMQIIGPEIEPRLDWLALTDALAQGHELPRAEIADSFLYRGKDTLLTRSAWIDGLGLAVKPATLFPGNSERGAPVVIGVVNL